MSKKRKKKSPLRNDFTDALNVEMAERKIIERTQPKTEPAEESKVSLEKVDAEKIEVEKATKVEISKSEVPITQTEKVEVPKIEVEKISIEKAEEITAPPVEISEKVPIVEVKVDAKLEKRILKEADNNFFDKKPPKTKSPKVSTDKPRKSIFRSKGMQSWEEEQEEKITPPKIEPTPKVETPRKMSRPEKFGGIMSVVMLVYAFANMDKPLFFLALSMFAHFLSYSIASVFGKHAAAVQNAIHTFSIVIFFGAIMFLFTD